jgi:acetyl-CoA synthetase
MIKAKIEAENPRANLGAYDRARERFSWLEEEKTFKNLGSDRVNIVEEAVDRWAGSEDDRDRTALVFEGLGRDLQFTFGQLQEMTCKWANLLLEHGFRQGERFFIFLPPCPEAYFAMLACARMGMVFCNMFSTATYDELEVRLKTARPAGVLTHPDLAERLPPDSMESVRSLLLTTGPPAGLSEQELVVEDLIEEMPPFFENRLIPRRSPLYMNFTSGSAGTPKGIVHTHHDMVGIRATARFVLDLTPESLVWTESHPAWVTGTVYGVFGPLLCGAATLVQADPFSASNVYRTLEKHKVSVWYTTPTTIRNLMEAGDDLPGRYDFSHLRHIATVGEPLVPDLFYWGKKNLKHSLHDTWWMTETGIICLANFPSMDIKPGSMGKPIPGLEIAVLSEEGELLQPMTMGELAIRVDWPGLMSAIWGDDERYKEYFIYPGWFLTGDMALMDDDGYFYHHGRNDDLIKVEGFKLIGPYEIEQALCMHPSVSEAAVIAKSGEPGSGRSFIKAFIVLNPSVPTSTRLSQEIRAFLRANLSPEIDVREISFIDKIPKTRSGKVLRRVLRAEELGLPVGRTLNLKD